MLVPSTSVTIGPHIFVEETGAGCTKDHVDITYYH